MEQQIKEFDSLTELLEDLEKKGIQGRKRRDIVLTFLTNQARVKERPIAASFELTPLCNFDCKMCYVHLSKEQLKERELLTVEQWQLIADMAVEAGVMSVDLTGGECLTYPGFKEVYSYLYNRGIQPSVLTNGSLLTEGMVGFFEKQPPKMIQVTLYGSNSAAYRKVTGCDAFEVVVAGLERLQEAKLRYKLVVTPSKYMQEDAFALLEYLRKMNIDYGIGGVSLSARPETERYLDDYEIDEKCFAEIQKNEVEYQRSLPVSKTNDDFYPLVMKRSPYSDGAPCGAAHNTFHVNWRGEMTPCVSFYSVTSSMIQNGFEKAWNEIRMKMREYQISSECRKCEYKEYCTSCPAEKCYGILGERLNEGVCRRIRAYSNAGILTFVKEGER